MKKAQSQPSYRWLNPWQWAIALTLFTQTLFGQPYAGKMGVESPGDVFIDLVKQSYRWDKPDGSGGWTGLTAADADANGWPRTDTRWIFDGRPVAEWFGTIDDPEAHRVDYGGVHRGSFTGQATLTKIEGPFTLSNQAYDAAKNVTTFDLTMAPPGPHHGLIVMSFTNTRRTSTGTAGSGITDFRLIRPGYAPAIPQVFTDEFIHTLTSARFAAIRFMGVTNTNNNIEWGPTSTLLQRWNNRKRITDAAQTEIGSLNKKDGWAWEYLIQLCNQVNMDLWINIPVSVDDDYITQLATLVKNNLNGNLKVYLEHSNEMWNFGFLQYSWNKARAVEEVRAGTANYNYDGNTSEDVWAQRRHAKRTRDAVQLFGNVFGTSEINNRIRGVLAGTGLWEGFIVGQLSQMLPYLNANYGPPRNYLYSISEDLYYGGPAAGGEAGTENYSVQQIVDGMRVNADSQKSHRQSIIQLAATYGIPGGMSSYEGGPGIGGGRTENIANRIRAMRDLQQKEVYQRNFATNFWDLGGGLAMQFALASNYSRYGAWGITDDVNVPDRNALFGAVREMIGSGSGPNFSGYYLISAKHSNQVLDVQWGGTTLGTPLQQWSRNSTAAQQFRIVSTGDGYYKIVNRNSKLIIDVNEWSLTNGGRIHQWEYNRQPNQRWRLEAVGDDYYKIINQWSGKVLDVTGGSLASGVLMQQWDYLGGDNQKFKFEQVTGAARLGRPEVREADQPEAVAPALFPNPAVGNVTLRYRAARAEVVHVTVRDATGRTAYQTTMNAVAGDNALPIGLPATLKTGLHLVSVATREGRKEHKLMVVRQLSR